MNGRVVLGGLLVTLVVAIYLLSLAVGASSGSVDTGHRDMLDSFQSGMRNLPGLGTDLSPEAVDVDCFDRPSARFEVEPGDRCRFRIDEGIDRIPLMVVGGRCAVVVSDQPGVFDARTDSLDWENGRRDLGLTGDGASVEITTVLPGADRACVLELRR